MSTIRDRILSGDYYRTKEMMRADITLMLQNCKTYNEGTEYVKYVFFNHQTNDRMKNTRPFVAGLRQIWRNILKIRNSSLILKSPRKMNLNGSARRRFLLRHIMQHRLHPKTRGKWKKSSRTTAYWVQMAWIYLDTTRFLHQFDLSRITWTYVECGRLRKLYTNKQK